MKLIYLSLPISVNNSFSEGKVLLFLVPVFPSHTLTNTQTKKAFVSYNSLIPFGIPDVPEQLQYVSISLKQFVTPPHPPPFLGY